MWSESIEVLNPFEAIAEYFDRLKGGEAQTSSELKPCPFCGEPKYSVLCSIAYGIPSGDPGYTATIKCNCGVMVVRWALKKSWAIDSVKKHGTAVPERRGSMRLIDETEYQEKLAKIPMEVRTFRKAVEVAEDMPTIDAVQVIRCRECNYYGKNKRCVKSGLYTSEIDFCSFGERKEGAE